MKKIFGYCLIIDSGMNILKIKEKKLQELLDNKDIAPLDIKEQVGNDNITEMIEEILLEFKEQNENITEIIEEILTQFKE